MFESTSMASGNRVESCWPVPPNLERTPSKLEREPDCEAGASGGGARNVRVRSCAAPAAGVRLIVGGILTQTVDARASRLRPHDR
jgi:hypothetical protein